ncbi:increased loss of mitochondrial DNA protein 1 [Purpureocillium lavendulum]|uniref:Increased loss of mitochondrial DNA protein 1 n=1 Tax=Purpureocillium lavendulum TaxID=1247861 RepID=A0AB34G1C6_9HYPO|nr:increased loss of mitochondrial DNA protein 1 [Purpureocillium lavendulum]
MAVTVPHVAAANGLAFPQDLSEAPVAPLQPPKPAQQLAALDARKGRARLRLVAVLGGQCQQHQREEGGRQVRRAAGRLVAQRVRRTAAESAIWMLQSENPDADSGPFGRVQRLGRCRWRSVGRAQQVQGRDDEVGKGRYKPQALKLRQPELLVNTIITSISLFHLTLAFFFLTNPRTIDDQAIVFIMGESMGMSPALAFLAAVLALLGLSDLVSLSMPEELGALYYWGTQAPLRSLFSMLLVFYSYFLGPSSPIFGSASSRAGRRASAGIVPSSSSTASSSPSSSSPSYVYRPSGWGGDALKNRVFFTFMFLEMITWFWIWVTLREERAGVVEKLRAAGRADRRRSAHEHEE